MFHGLFLPQIVFVIVLRLSECGRRHARNCQPSRAQQETVVTAASVHVVPVQCEWHARCRGVHSVNNAMQVEVVVVGGCCLLSARAEESFTSPRRQPQWQPIIATSPIHRLDRLHEHRRRLARGQVSSLIIRPSSTRGTSLLATSKSSGRPSTSWPPISSSSSEACIRLQSPAQRAQLPSAVFKCAIGSALRALPSPATSSNPTFGPLASPNARRVADLSVLEGGVLG